MEEIMQYIKLTQGLFAIVDDDDYEVLMTHKWCAHRFGTRFYADSGKSVNGKIKGFLMHRVIMNVTNPKIQVDHINGNTLDNRRENLRKCTNSENCRNAKMKSTNTSGYKGVRPHVVRKKDGKQVWRAMICVDGKDRGLGLFLDKKEAARAYNKAAMRFYGNFAKLNII
jgi:hypothetical protein